MQFSLARQQFYQAVQPPDSEIDLATAALHLAQEEYPQLAVEAYQAQLDEMAAAVRQQLPAEPYPLRRIQVLNAYLYEELGYRGNTENYYDPRNSYLNDVMDRRVGIPISLSLLYLEVASRIGLPMVGIGFPGHFLVRPTVRDMAVFVDPFHQGEVLFIEDCQERLQQMYGPNAQLRSHFLEPVGARQFLGRMLNNLKMIYLNRQDITRALAAIERILLLFPNDSQERRDRGLLYYHEGRLIEARQDLEAYLDAVPQAEDAPEVQQLLKQIDQDI